VRQILPIRRWMPLALAAMIPLVGAAGVVSGEPRRVWRRAPTERGISLCVAGATTFLRSGFYDVYLPLRAGAGMEMALGYRWSRWLQTYVSMIYTEHELRPDWPWQDRYGFLVAELHVVVPLARWKRLRPAVVAGLGRGVLAGGEESLKGSSLLIGVQLEYFLTRRWTVGAGVRARYIDYSSVQYRLPTLLATGTVDGSNLNLCWIRMAWHLGRVLPWK